MQDICWLQSLAEADEGIRLPDSLVEELIDELEHQCAQNIKSKHVGIEYDDHVICDVCRRLVCLFWLIHDVSCCVCFSFVLMPNRMSDSFLSRYLLARTPRMVMRWYFVILVISAYIRHATASQLYQMGNGSVDHVKSWVATRKIYPVYCVPVLEVP